MTGRPIISGATKRSCLVFLLLIALTAPAQEFDSSQASSTSATTIDFQVTAEERLWLDAHPVIRVAGTQDWPPFEYVDADGAYQGISIELLRLLSERIGFDLEPVTGKWTDVYAMLLAGELDLCPGMGITPEREEHLLFTRPLLEFPHAIYVREGDTRINLFSDLYGKQIAIERNFYTHELIKREHPEIDLVPVENARRALLSVSNGETDAYIGNTAVASYLINKNVILGLRPVWSPEIASLPLSIAVRKEYAPLIGMLNRAIAELSPRDRQRVVAQYTLATEAVRLTPEEQAWIAAHPEIRLGIDPEFAPFEFLADDNSHQGMASEYVALLNQRLGLNMTVVRKETWGDTVQMALDHEIDALPCIGFTETRAQSLTYSEPYLSFYRIIVTRNDSPLITGLHDLSGSRVGVQENSSHHGFLQEESTLSLETFDSIQATLAAVSQGEVNAAVGNVATVSYWIRMLGLTNLRIAAPADTTVNNLYFAVRNDWPELVSILNKGLATISEDEAQAIRNKWVDVEVDQKMDLSRPLRLAVGVLALAIILSVLLGLHNSSLRNVLRTQQRVEEALRRSEENYRTLVESANSIILRMKPDGTIVFINKFGERFFGYTLKELVGRNIIGTIVPETDLSGQDLRELMLRLGQKPENFEVNENENITRSGERKWIAWTNRPLIDSNGIVTEILAVGGDMTARRNAEAMLSRYEFIVNTVHDMMSVLNREGIYEAVNGAWCLAMNIDRDEVLGKSVDDLWLTETAASEIWPNLHRCLAGELVTYESVLHIPEAGDRYCEVTMHPSSDSTGKITHAVIVTHDVTEWRMNQAALRDAKRAAETANQAKSAFLANMSHEIRTPMNAILGYTQLLQRQANPAPDQRHALDAISRSSDHLLSLIDDVLEMAKIEAGRSELRLNTFNLDGLLTDMEVMFQVRMNAKGLSFAIDRGDIAMPIVHADEGRLRQILINLLENALKFTDRGHIHMRIRCEEGQDPGTCAIHFEVEDTGCGIAPTYTTAVFDSFEQAGSAALRRGGTGLGLAISRKFARMMHGDITVTSEEGVGSCFKFTMLAALGNPDEIELRKPERTVKYLTPGQREIRVLVVDDRATNRDLLCRLLQKVGFLSREANNGLEGVDQFQKWKPHVVLMDLVMPEMDGRAAITEIRSLPGGEDVVIIAVTASTLIGEKDEVLAHGADGFLRKPFRDNELFELIGTFAHLSFEYDTPGDADVDQVTTVTRESAIRDLAGLSSEVRGRLRNVVLTGNIDEAYRIAKEICAQAPQLASLLEEHANAYSLYDLNTIFQDGSEA